MASLYPSRLAGEIGTKSARSPGSSPPHQPLHPLHLLILHTFPFLNPSQPTTLLHHGRLHCHLHPLRRLRCRDHLCPRRRVQEVLPKQLGSFLLRHRLSRSVSVPSTLSFYIPRRLTMLGPVSPVRSIADLTRSRWPERGPRLFCCDIIYDFHTKAQACILESEKHSHLRKPRTYEKTDHHSRALVGLVRLTSTSSFPCFPTMPLLRLALFSNPR
jgi:hypothetical protein